MRRLAWSLTTALIASSSLISCATIEDDSDEDLGDIGDGKADSFGIVDRATTIAPGHTRQFTFHVNAAFRIAITQPETAVADRQVLDSTLTEPSAHTDKLPKIAEPTYVYDGDIGTGKFKLVIKNTGTQTANVILNIRPLAGFGDLPDPNAAVYPELAWQPGAMATWPNTYPIFNNPGCGKTCTQAQQTEMGKRSVMIKMLVSAIHEVSDHGIVRVSNYNISSSATAKPVVDALVWAMQTQHATVKIVMDDAQNIAGSKTTWLAQNGAEVRFLNGLHYTGSSTSVGIMHSKIVAVDDKVVFTGSNNFSGSGFITNEENSVMLRGTANAPRIGSFICDIDKMFDIGVEAGQPQKSDADRKTAVLALDQCNGADVWFPPTGMTANGSSITFEHVKDAIANAKRSISIAPDMMANPDLIYTIIARAKKAKTAGNAFSVKLVLDASEEALGNPAFGDCLEVAAQKHGYDLQVRYWRGNADIFQLNHHKFMIIDEEDPTGAALYNGSANYSSRAMQYSFENVTRYQGDAYRAVVDAFTARFANMFTAAQTKADLPVAAPSCPLSQSSL